MTPSISQRSLADRLNEGKLPVGDALRFAMTLADALRRLHDSGRVYGALSPSHIGFNGTTVELGAAPDHSGVLTPYTAPEVLHGKPADARSDIFAFGAILFEMLTGRRAFDGDSEASLSAALIGSAPASSGSPLVDRLVASCVAKDPAVRCQRMQKIIMELKLLSVAARRAEVPAPKRGEAEAQLRAEMQQMEARFGARLESHQGQSAANLRAEIERIEGQVSSRLVSHEQAAAHTRESHAQAIAELQQGHEQSLRQLQENHERSLRQQHEGHEQSLKQMQDAAGEAINALRGQLADVSARIAEAQQNMAQPIAEVREMGQQIVGSVEHTIAPIGQRLADVEEALQDLRNRSTSLQENVAADLNGIEQSLKAHAAAIESARTATAQTDDLVERVVEALELLQTSVLDQHGERATLID